jgi:hypothetical protein
VQLIPTANAKSDDIKSVSEEPRGPLSRRREMAVTK